MKRPIDNELSNTFKRIKINQNQELEHEISDINEYKNNKNLGNLILSRLKQQTPPIIDTATNEYVEINKTLNELHKNKILFNQHI